MDKKCGAKSKTNHHLPCRLRALSNGRCRFHGGKSTGPTEEGRKRLAEINTKHGYWSKERIAERRKLRMLFKELRA